MDLAAEARYQRVAIPILMVQAAAAAQAQVFAWRTEPGTPGWGLVQASHSASAKVLPTRAKSHNSGDCRLVRSVTTTRVKPLANSCECEHIRRTLGATSKEGG